MSVMLKLTRLPNLNDTIVIRQSGGHYFIAAPDSIVIDKSGLLRLILELGKVGYLEDNELEAIADFVKGWNKERRKEEDAEN